MKNLKLIFILLMGLMQLWGKVVAQPIVKPTLPSQTAGSLSATNPITTVNCDMLEYVSTGGDVGFLKAIVWDDKDIATINDAYLYLDDGFSNTNISLGSLGIMWPRDPDVVIGHDINNPGDFIVVVVLNAGPMINLHFSITGVGTGAMTATFLPALSGAGMTVGADCKPHIDLLADPNMLINGHPALHRMVTLYTNTAGQAFYWVTEIDNPLAGGLTGTIPTFPNGAKVRDVAAYTNVVTNEQQVVYAADNANTLLFGTFNATTLVFLPPNPLGVASSIPTAKIEAMNLYDPANGGTIWQIAALMGNEVRGYNSLNPGGFLASTASWDYMAPAVAAGVGRPSIYPGNVGNQNYILGFYKAGDHVYNQNIAWNTGTLPPPPVNFWYRVSNNPFTAGGTDMFAVSSASNSGGGILTAWSDGVDILYKESPNAMKFKIAGMDDEYATPAVKVYPNPASDKLYLDNAASGTAYTLMEASGKTVREGTYQTEGIDVRHLAKGIYFIKFKHQSESCNLTFTKL